MTTTTPNTLSQRLRERSRSVANSNFSFYTALDAKLDREAADAHDALVEVLQNLLEVAACPHCCDDIDFCRASFAAQAELAKHAQPATGGEENNG